MNPRTFWPIFGLAAVTFIAGAVFVHGVLGIMMMVVGVGVITLSVIDKEI
jgi:hypothetical protein